jgi:hypothetical protein
MPLQRGVQNLNLLTYLCHLRDRIRPACIGGLTSFTGATDDQYQTQGASQAETSGAGTSVVEADGSAKAVPDMKRCNTSEQRSSLCLWQFSDKIFAGSTISENFVLPRAILPTAARTSRASPLRAPFFFHLASSNHPLGGDDAWSLRAIGGVYSATAFGLDTTQATGQTPKVAAASPKKGEANGNPRARRGKLVSASGARQYFIKKSRNKMSIHIHLRVPKGRKDFGYVMYTSFLACHRGAKQN